MFDRNLADALKHVHEDEKNVVLAFLVTEQLLHLGDFPAEDIRTVLNRYYKSGNENYNLIETSAHRDGITHPILYCCRALTTASINDLDPVAVGNCVTWLAIQAKTDPEFTPLYNSMVAIQTMMQVGRDEKITLPSDCYLNFAGAALEGVNLSGLDLSHANLAGANLKNANLKGTKLVGAHAVAANFTSAQLTDANLDEANLHEATLTAANLQYASMNKANFAMVNAERADFQAAKAMQACFHEAKFKDADFQGAILNGSLLFDADFTSARLSGANMLAAKMKNTNFTGAVLWNANLQKVNFNGSLNNADLTGANLRGAKLCSTNLDLHGANLSRAQFNASTQFLFTKGNCPDNTYSRYVKNKKAMLSQAKFVDGSEFDDPQKFDNELAKLYLMLKDNVHFKHMQDCMGNDFISRAYKLLTDKPELAHELRDTAYTSNLFKTNVMLFRAVNEVVDAWHELRDQPEGPYKIESDAQKQIRAGLSNLA